MDESYSVSDSAYSTQPPVECTDNAYKIDPDKYILSLEFYTLVADVRDGGKYKGTETIQADDYEVTIESYVYEPPIARYPSWTFGDALWRVVSVAGVIVACVVIYKYGVIGKLKSLFVKKPELAVCMPDSPVYVTLAQAFGEHVIQLSDANRRMILEFIAEARG